MVKACLYISQIVETSLLPMIFHPIQIDIVFIIKPAKPHERQCHEVKDFVQERVSIKCLNICAS